MLKPHRSRDLLSWLALLLATALILGGCAPAAAPAAQTAGSTPRSITVVGQGTASGQPDLAQASLGVETYADTVAEASNKNNAKMATLLAKLKELGIADKDIQTSNYSINFERQGSDMSNGQYRVSNMVTVKIRDLSKVGPTLDAIIQAGANQVWGVSFMIEDQKALTTIARTKAIDDANERAQALAKLSNVKVGQVLTISEGTPTGPIFAAGGFAKGAADGTAVNPGEVQVSYQVQVTYAIE